MKLKLIAALFLLALYSCGNKTDKGTQQQGGQSAAEQWQPPAAGTVIDNMAQRTDDKLNESYFRVSIIGTDSSKAGHYILKLEYGYNINEVPVVLPAWTNNTILRPLLRKGPGKYHCFVGFEANDNQFHELYEITVVNDNIKFKQTRGYYKSTDTQTK